MSIFQYRSVLAGIVITSMLAGCGGDNNNPPQQSEGVVDSEQTTDPTDSGSGNNSQPVACEPPPPNSLRNAYFGELHLHTEYSLDAVATRLKPEDAYRFALGEAVAAPPYDEAGNSLIPPHQIDRPLDFAAITDHGEWLGEQQLCTDPTIDTVAYNSPECVLYREDKRMGFLLFGGGWAAFSPGIFPQPEPGNLGYLTEPQAQRPIYCGPLGEKCTAAARSPWQDIQLQAERFNQPGCFTTFNAYEYTLSPQSDNLHRNVIFNGIEVPQRPISVYEAPTPPDLWRALDEVCNGDCEYLTIPHNSNLSNGRMFASPEEDGYDVDERRRAEPLIEIFQVKGDSECNTAPGASENDPLCNFEQLPSTNFMEFFLGVNPLPTAPARTNTVRYGLKQGLLFEQQFGANPFQYGFVASTDSHFGLPGSVDEQNFPGHRDVPPARGVKDDWYNNPGGLAVAWAEENTRDALFDAFKRKETYATSGPRMQLRMFGGNASGLPENMCAGSGESFVRRGDAGGVPMGSELHTGQGRPRLAIWAAADAWPRENGRTAAVPLARLQVIKGWLEQDDSGNTVTRQRVYDVAGSERSDWQVDTSDCSVSGSGPAQLCAVWDDPDFDASQSAFYYSRVVEQPTCRWLTRQCLAAPENLDCSDPPAEWAGCCEAEAPATVQERAWASPIWYKQ